MQGTTFALFVLSQVEVRLHQVVSVSQEKLTLRSFVNYQCPSHGTGRKRILDCNYSGEVRTYRNKVLLTNGRRNHCMQCDHFHSLFLSCTDRTSIFFLLCVQFALLCTTTLSRGKYVGSFLTFVLI